MPANWGLAFWMAFQYAGARAGMSKSFILCSELISAAYYCSTAVKELCLGQCSVQTNEKMNIYLNTKQNLCGSYEFLANIPIK